MLNNIVLGITISCLLFAITSTSSQSIECYGENKRYHRIEKVFNPSHIVACVIIIHNKYSLDNITVYWSEYDDDGILHSFEVGRIQPQTSISTTAYPGTKIHAKFENQSIASPKQMVVKKIKKSYKFGINSTKSKSKTISFNNSNNSCNIIYTDEILQSVVKPYEKRKGILFRFKIRCLLFGGCDIFTVFDEENTMEEQIIKMGSIEFSKEIYFRSTVGTRMIFTERGSDYKIYKDVILSHDEVIHVIYNPDNKPKKLFAQLNKQLKFMKEYLNRNGMQFIHYFDVESGQPRPPPVHLMWPSIKINHIHTVHQLVGYWQCADATCNQSPPIPFLQLQTISIHPRIFFIKDFVSFAEVNHIIDLAKPHLKTSEINTDNEQSSRIRSSSNAWIHRSRSPIINTIFHRAAQVMNLDESILNHNTSAENLQVVYYETGQKYDEHYDWNGESPHSRFITLLIYLNDDLNGLEGGETAFPLARNLCSKSNGFKIQPKLGSAVLFYNLLEDGNGDELTLHAALPVESGEKWLANLWVWDKLVPFSK